MQNRAHAVSLVTQLRDQNSGLQAKLIKIWPLLTESTVVPYEPLVKWSTLGTDVRSLFSSQLILPACHLYIHVVRWVGGASASSNFDARRCWCSKPT
jgi:hypothetical protein